MGSTKLARNKRALIGAGFILLSLVLLGVFYAPTLISRYKHTAEAPTSAAEENSTPVLTKKEAEKKPDLEVVVPIDEDFGLVIPKIETNTSVIADVDPFIEDEYKTALLKGIAHSKTSARPDENGNVFLFAHSDMDYYQTKHLNVNFYLLDKLEAGDKVYIFYEGKKHLYIVDEVKIVDPSEVSYAAIGSTEDRTLTLMTCWPAGINYKRVVVQATFTE